MSKEFYDIRSVLSYDWAIFYFLLGGREAGKSYATTEFFVRQWKEKKRPFYWLRLTEASQKKLLNNKADKLIDPDIKRKYNLDITTSGDCVYEVTERDEKGKVVKKELMARVMALSTFYNDKGSGLFDKDFLDNPDMYYNICLDEMNREANEKNTFDIVYGFVNQLENLIRSTKVRVRVICIGNTLEEASDLLTAFNFLPEDFGRYKLVKNKKKLVQYIKEYKRANSPEEKKKINEKYKNIDFGKRAIIDYIEPSEEYKTRRKGTIADIVSPDSSTFTNEVKIDNTLITKKRLIKPTFIIKFDKDTMYTVWDGRVICPYNNEKVKVIAMRPSIDEVFDIKSRDTIIMTYNIRGFRFRTLICSKLFKKSMIQLGIK